MMHMLSITIAIAQLRGLLTQQVKAIVSLMQSAGLVRREHTTQIGNPYFVVTTSHHSQPASIQPSQNKEAVQSTIQEPKSGKGNKTAQQQPEQQLTAVGSKSKTPASKTLPPAKSAQKANKSRAKRGTPDKSHK
jgi:hypothetical protein